MSYLDTPPTTYTNAVVPGSDVDFGGFDRGVFSSDGPLNSSGGGTYTVNGTVQYYSVVYLDGGVQSQFSQVVAIAPNSFVVRVPIYQLGGYQYTFYYQLTNPDYGPSVGSFDYRPYRYDPSITCFSAGTRLSVENGTKLVEDIRPGDLVRTISDQLRPVIWCGSRRIDCRWHPNPRMVLPVRVAPDAFGPGQPGRNLYLSPDHAVFAAGVLVPIRHLVNGTTVRQVDVTDVTYHHIELETHDVVLAEGLPCETFLDTGNRATLLGDEATGQPLPGIPDQTYMLWEALGAAPLLTGGPQVDRIRADLLSRTPRVDARAKVRLSA